MSWLMIEIKAHEIDSLEISPANTLLGCSFSFTNEGPMHISVILFIVKPFWVKLSSMSLVLSSLKLYESM